MAVNLSVLEKKILVELSNNARISDRALSKKLSVSQPTITRIRGKLFESGIISSSTITPSLSKLGLNLMVFTFVRFDSEIDQKLLKKWLDDADQVYFGSEGEGMRGHTLVLVSMNRDFAHYSEYVKDLRKKFSGKLVEIDSFFIGSSSYLKDPSWHKLLKNHLDGVQEKKVEKD